MSICGAVVGGRIPTGGRDSVVANVCAVAGTMPKILTATTKVVATIMILCKILFIILIKVLRINKRPFNLENDNNKISIRQRLCCQETADNARYTSSY